MKLMLKLTYVLVFTILATRLIAQSTQSITVSFQDVTLENVLADLARQYSLKFSYSEDLVELDKKIQVRVDAVSLEELLRQIFLQANVEYKQIGDQIVIRERPLSAPAVLRGKVIDKLSGVPLPFASVRVDGTALGTATNSDGIFILKVPQGYGEGKLIISYIGYSSHIAALSDLKTEAVFQLEEDSRELQTVVVTAKTGASVLEEAISRIQQNYDTGDVRYSYFVRDLSSLDEAPIGASETLYQAYRGSQATGLQEVKVLRGRRIKDFGAVQRILQTFIRWTGFELGIAGNVIFSTDLNLQRTDGGFPSSKFMIQHQFDLLGVSLLDGKEVYVVDFDQKPGVRKSLYKGRFYIETESLAFSRIEIGLSPQGIARARFFNTPKSLATLFGYGKCAINELKTIINYKSLDGKWYPSTIEKYWSADLIKPKKQFYSTVEVTGNIVVTDIQTENISPFSDDKSLAGNGAKNLEYFYRSASLDQFNAIETDLDIQDAFQSIALQNSLQGMDTRFWKRYPPYKSNPSMLSRDSLLCLQPEASAARLSLMTISNTLTDDGEVNIMKPKYPLLNKSFTTEHFVLHHLQEDSFSAREVSEVLESNYGKVLHEFGWKSLEDVIHVEIYPDSKHYHFAIGRPDAPDSDVGMAVDPNLFKMVSPGNPGAYHTRESLFKAAVHEFVHCVHYHFIESLSQEERTGISNQEEAPWLFEAMASYCAGQFYHPARFEYILKGRYPTIQALNEVEDNGKIYDLGFVVIEFIKQAWGQEALVVLLRKNGNVQDAFNVSERAFETRFYRYIKEKYALD